MKEYIVIHREFSKRNLFLIVILFSFSTAAAFATESIIEKDVNVRFDSDVSQFDDPEQYYDEVFYNRNKVVELTENDPSAQIPDKLLDQLQPAQSQSHRTAKGNLAKDNLNDI